MRWRLLNHELGDITLDADGRTISRTAPTNTPVLDFDLLDPSTKRLTVSTKVSATIQKTTRRKYQTADRDCKTRTIGEGEDQRTVRDCDTDYDTYWRTSVSRYHPETRVSDDVDVEVYALSPSASRTVFTDGSSALAVNQSHGDPWTSYRLPDGSTVHNVWHFYSARDDNWDELIESSEAGTISTRSESIPLQVHAFPSAGGAYARSEFGMLDITNVWGPERDPPILPTSITLPLVEEEYSTGSVVVTNVDSSVDLTSGVFVTGLVRGTETRIPIQTDRHQRTADLGIELLELNRSTGTAIVRVSLFDEVTGQSIDLSSRPGVVRVQGIEMDLDSTGTAVLTVPLGGRQIYAEYEAGPWWATEPVYESTSASATPPTTWPKPSSILSAGTNLALWLTPFLLGIVLIDRLLGRGRFWPPWRGIE